MEIFNVIRAWKDVRYRNSLSAEEQALLPENPAGSIELNEDELDGVVGGLEEEGTKKVGSAGCCSKYRSNKKCCGSTGIDDGDDGGPDEPELPE